MFTNKPKSYQIFRPEFSVEESTGTYDDEKSKILSILCNEDLKQNPSFSRIHAITKAVVLCLLLGKNPDAGKKPDFIKGIDDILLDATSRSEKIEKLLKETGIELNHT